MKNILVIKLGAFGDLLACTGYIREIRSKHSDDRLTLLTTSSYKKLFASCPWINSILIDPRKPRLNILSLYRLFRELNSYRFDKIYDLQANDRTKMYTTFVRTQWFRGWKEIAQELEPSEHKLQKKINPDVEWMVKDATEFLKKQNVAPGYIFLIPGSSARHPQKRWPYYAELARELMSRGFTVVTAPGPDEMHLCKDFPCTILYDEEKAVSMNLLAGIIQKARFVVGNDTGPTHLAAYLGIPGLALFGSHANAQSTGLYRFLDIIEVKSLKKLSVSSVAERVFEILSKNQNS